MKFILKRSTIISFLFSILVYCFTYYLSLFYIGGDQAFYIEFYDNISNLNIGEAVLLYYNQLGASEPVYLLLIYLLNGFLQKNVLMSIINGVIAFCLSKMLIKREVNIFFVLTIFFQYYFVVLF